MIAALPLATLLTLTVPASLDGAAHEAWANLLATHVKNGRVDYKGIEKDRGRLDTFLKAVATANLPKDRDQRIAFYTDAYNALVIASVLEHGRPRSVLDVKGFFKEPVHTVAGEKVSLDQLEKEKLGPFAKDPRTHFVLVCAAVGCPILESKPYLGTNMDARMDAATRRYLASPHGARVEPGTLKLSKIFDWYAADFGGEAGVRSFVLKHLPAGQKTTAGPEPKVAFIDYNWTLNQQ